MQPTLTGDRELILIRRFRASPGGLGYHDVQRGDIVTLFRPDAAHRRQTKRVTGVEHETVSYAHPPSSTCHTIEVSPLLAPIPDPAHSHISLAIFSKVPRNHYFVEGDNAGQSYDSRSYGAIPANLVEGKVVAKLWPSFVRLT